MPVEHATRRRHREGAPLLDESETSAFEIDRRAFCPTSRSPSDIEAVPLALRQLLPTQIIIAKAHNRSQRRGGQSAGDLACLALCFLLFEGVDQFERREEPHALAMMFDGLDNEGRSDVGFAGAGTAEQHDIVDNVHEVAAVELIDQRLIDLAASKVEARQIAIGWKPCDFEMIGDR